MKAEDEQRVKELIAESLRRMSPNGYWGDYRAQARMEADRLTQPEAKFKVGQWIIGECTGAIWRVQGLVGKRYYCVSIFGNGITLLPDLYRLATVEEIGNRVCVEGGNEELGKLIMDLHKRAE